MLKAELITEKVACQLYAAVCSIEANISEGYSRSSGKDRARIFGYALGSVRESMSWYKSSRPVLGGSTVKDRRDRLEEMRRLLLAIVDCGWFWILKVLNPHGPGFSIRIGSAVYLKLTHHVLPRATGFRQENRLTWAATH